jgi:phosphatidylinositol 4-kinase A
MPPGMSTTLPNYYTWQQQSSNINNNNNNNNNSNANINKSQQPTSLDLQQQQYETQLKREQKQHAFFRDYMKKRYLLLFLLSHELDHLYTFHNYANTPPASGGPFERIEQAISHMKISTTDKQWIDHVRIAWSVSPTLAVFIPVRFPLDIVIREVQALVKLQPERVAHVEHACNYLATEANISNDSIELNNLLTWAKVPVITSLSYFGKGASRQNSAIQTTSQAHPIVAQFASKNLMLTKPEILLDYIPQLVQSVRYDIFGYVREVILWLAKHSQLLSHQLIWNMTTNVYRDQDSKIRDPVIGDILESLITDINESLTGNEKEFLLREFDFFQELTDVSAKIAHIPLGDERKRACEQALSQVHLVNNCYLPSNPDAIVMQILDGTPMQSAAKAPYLARFVAQRIKLSDLEHIGRTGDEVTASLALQFKCACIFKVGDDVRQDMLALQIIQLMKNVFQHEGLDLYLFPYRVVATKPGCGVIECVPDSSSRDQIGRQTDIDLHQYFLDKYGVDTPEFQRARRNFITSMAGYSLFMFLLQIKDRHNGNLMIDKQGHLIHIDFGFMIESSPGGNIGFEPDMKITTEMGLIMGRDINSPFFQFFIELVTKGYLAIRPYREQICTLVSMLIETGLPCFRSTKPIDSLRGRFQPTYTEREAATYVQKIITTCYNNLRTNTYDRIQYMQNSIYH